MADIMYIEETAQATQPRTISCYMRYLPTHRYVLLKLQSHKYKSSNRHTGHTDDVRLDGQSTTTTRGTV